MVTDPEFPRLSEAPRRRTASATPRLRTVALVGIDGSGKTTQAHRLATDLAALGLPATYRRNAGGRRWFGRVATLLGRRDAEHLLGRRATLLVESVLRWLAIARTLLRRAVTREIAVMDRYAVCQFASLRSHAPHPGRKPGPNRAERRARLAYRMFPAPDVTFLLVVDPAVAYDRIEARGYDHEEMDYLRHATAAYRALPEYPSFVVIDANGTPDEVAAAIRAELAARFSAQVPAPAHTSDPVQVSAPGQVASPVHVAVEQAVLPVPRSAPVPHAEPASMPDTPVTTAAPGLRATAILLVTGPLAAGASTVGSPVSEAVRALV